MIICVLWDDIFDEWIQQSGAIFRVAESRGSQVAAGAIAHPNRTWPRHTSLSRRQRYTIVGLSRKRTTGNAIVAGCPPPSAGPRPIASAAALKIRS